MTPRMLYKQGHLLPLSDNLQLLSSHPPERRGITTGKVEKYMQKNFESLSDRKQTRRIYIVEVGRQLLDVLLQFIGRLQAVLEETAEQRKKGTG